MWIVHFISAIEIVCSRCDIGLEDYNMWFNSGLVVASFALFTNHNFTIFTNSERILMPYRFITT